MHISEGVLSLPVLASGAALAAAGTAVGLKKMNYDRVPQAAILASVFFVASLVHVPIGPSSVHLILNGLLGLLLGWVAFPVILIALVLQAILFQFGGLTSLGANTFNMAFPAVACYCLLGRAARSNRSGLAAAASFAAGFLSILLASLMMGLSLWLSGESFRAAAGMIIIAHTPVMVIEGILTAVCVRFLKKVKPEVLDVLYAM